MDELHITRDRVLVVNQSRAVWQGRTLGTVTTIRDRTDLEALTGELDATRAFAESLRSQAHESANRLHTVVSLIEMDRAEEAARFAAEELELAQALTDRSPCGRTAPTCLCASPTQGRSWIRPPSKARSAAAGRRSRVRSGFRAVDSDWPWYARSSSGTAGRSRDGEGGAVFTLRLPVGSAALVEDRP
jgi:hypothetical protein